MLDIESIELRNFLSYGDYVTKVKVSKQGPVLVLGKVDEDSDADASNGAGKSSLLTAFIWGLFGRTVTNANPGDKVINFFVGRECYVTIKTTDGWEIKRTRDYNGHSELMVMKDDKDETKSTNTNAQKKLDELFKLDYEIFTSSIFCGQFGKPFLEMTSVKRKEAIERLLGLDRLNGYADAAKQRSKNAETDQETIRAGIDILTASDKQYQDQVRENWLNKGEYEQGRRERIAGLAEALDVVREQAKLAPSHDIVKLEKQWETCNIVSNKIDGYRKKLDNNISRIVSLGDIIRQSKVSLDRYDDWEPEDELDIDEINEQLTIFRKAEHQISLLTDKSIDLKTEIQRQQIEVNSLTDVIRDWEDQSGSTCTSCLQEIDGKHAEHQANECKEKITKINHSIMADETKHVKILSFVGKLKKTKRPDFTVSQAKSIADRNDKTRDEIDHYRSVVDTSQKEWDDLRTINGGLSDSIKSLSIKLEKVTPSVTLKEAKAQIREHASLASQKKQLADQIAELQLTDNPYSLLIDNLKDLLKINREKMDDFNEKLESLDTLYKHYRYIYRSYSDRRKIKKWLMSELIPFLNNRVHYYLDKFELGINVKFTSTLDVESDKWSYEFCSGGERKRIDLAIMFGLYDLYTSIYGRQCNIMVLDEVDSKLDKRGVEAFSDIINDLTEGSESPDTVFVISHKRELESVFPTQIVIRKRNMFSVVDQT